MRMIRSIVAEEEEEEDIDCGCLDSIQFEHLLPAGERQRERVTLSGFTPDSPLCLLSLWGQVVGWSIGTSDDDCRQMVTRCRDFVITENQIIHSPL